LGPISEVSEFLTGFREPPTPEQVLATAIRCALAVVDALERIGLPARSGLHTGECELVGEKLTGSQSMSAPASPRAPRPARSSSPTLCATSSPARASSSKTVASTS
jgi:hypothetical protein